MNGVKRLERVVKSIYEANDAAAAFGPRDTSLPLEWQKFFRKRSSELKKQVLYPIPILCLFNLVVGNSIYIVLHLYAAIKTRKYFLVPYAIFIPLYWVLISIGCWKGTLQLITRPFYWEKTTHAIYKAK